MNEDPQVVAAEVSLSPAIAMPQAEQNELEAVVREHTRLVYRVAYSLLRNHHDAEDAAQETFLRLLRCRHKLALVRDIKAWLVRLAWRVALDRKNKLPEISMDDMDERPDPIHLPEAQAEHEIRRQQLATTLHKLIAGLPPKLRDPLVLSTLEELSTADISAALGLSESVVRSRVFRARRILKQKLARVWEENHGTLE